MIHTAHLKIKKKIHSRERGGEEKTEEAKHRCETGNQTGDILVCRTRPKQLSRTIPGHIPGHKEGNSCSTHL